MRQSSTINLKTIVTAGFFAAVTFSWDTDVSDSASGSSWDTICTFWTYFVVLGVLLQGGKKVQYQERSDLYYLIC